MQSNDSLPDDSPLLPQHESADDDGTLTDEETQHNAQRHFNTYASQCTRTPKCELSNYLRTCISFARMKEQDRVHAIRCMLFALTAPVEGCNDLNEWDPKSGSNRKRRHSTALGNAQVQTVYALKGQRLCRSCFGAVVYMHPGSINHHASEVSKTFEADVYSPNLSQRRKGIVTPQTAVAVSFLDRYADNNALMCPTGRGASAERPLQLLQSDVTREAVYKAYTDIWQEMMTFYMDNGTHGASTASHPSAPLGQKSFGKVWFTQRRTLRITKPGSDYCDTCTTLTNTANSSSDDASRDAILMVKQKHREEANAEFHNYRVIQDLGRAHPDGEMLHIVFDFAEKVLLPQLLRQPGQLYFVTGLKFDFFGVAISNFNYTDIHCLPEGHWPGGKTANEVASMLDHSINTAKNRSTFAGGVRKIVLHADNCGGQNKNKFMLWFFLWRVTVQLEDEITLNFLVAGHTKNRCDGAFGFVKRRLKTHNVVTSRQMMRVVSESSSTNHVVCSVDVRWLSWKGMLEKFYTVPSTFRITRSHVFKFLKASPEVIYVKALSRDEEWSEVRLLKRSVTAHTVRLFTANEFANADFETAAVPLSEVPSANEANRKAYLEKNILERYYSGDDVVARGYFADGKDWESAHHSDAQQ